MKGTNLVVALESRLDNIVFRMGFAPNRKAARQLVLHGHVEVNGGKVDVASYVVKPGQEVRIAEASRDMLAVRASLEFAARGQPVSWIQVNAEKASGKVTERPTREATTE